MPEENLFQRRDAKDSQTKQPNAATNSYQGPADKSNLRDRGDGYSASAKVVDYGHGNKPGNDYSGKSLFVCQSHVMAQTNWNNIFIHPCFHDFRSSALE